MSRYMETSDLDFLVPRIYFVAKANKATLGSAPSDISTTAADMAINSISVESIASAIRAILDNAGSFACFA